MSEAVSSQISFFSVSYDAIFTTVFTIIVFSLGLYFARRLDRNKEKKRLEELGVYYLDLLSSLIEPIKKQRQHLKSLADSIKDKKSRNFEYKESSDLLFDVFDQIPNQDIYKIFIINKKSSGDDRYVHYGNILHCIEFLKLQRIRSRRNVDRFMKDLRRYQSDWNDNVMSIGRSFDRYLSILHGKGIKVSEDPFFDKFNALLTNLRKLDDFRNMYVYKENFLGDLKKHCQGNYDDPRAFELIEFIVSANYAFNDLVNLKKFYSKAFQDESEKLRDFKNKLEQAVEFFGNT